MAKPTKRKVPGGPRREGGRVTPKGTQPQITSTSPTPHTVPQNLGKLGPSPMWVPVLMFSLLGVGALMILLNYLGVLPGAPDTWWLVGGLGLILGGIITATQFR
jgi:hypothetical protein